MADHRLKRVEFLIRDHISSLIINGVVKDPRVSSFISVTEVEVSKDIAYAKIFISSFQSDKKVDDAVTALNHAAGFIQSKLGKKLKMRNTPKLKFYKDNSVRHGMEMINKIKDLNI